MNIMKMTNIFLLMYISCISFQREIDGGLHMPGGGGGGLQLTAPVGDVTVRASRFP